MATKPLDADLSGTPVDQTKYRSMVGALMYLTTSRPNIVHATCYYAHYQARPTEKHLKEVKRIFRCLKNTINMGLGYPKDTGFNLIAFSDSNHAGCLDTRKSTSSVIQFLVGDKLVTWSLKKQDCTSMSSAEADHSLLVQSNPASRTKYIDVRYHFIKEHVEKGIVELYFIGTEYQLVDLFTKALAEDRFKYLVKRLGMRCLTPEELEVQTSVLHPHSSKVGFITTILKLQKSFIQLKCNKNVISQKAQVHVKFSNSDDHELSHHQRSSKSNQELSS
ncbi:hypothetical protein Tco_1030637 [Tanacetum coccineum]|uniref:Retrovirus-related Pol polyprotein from transposon TNT 1-94 n=1 Tax=Tanacetum coccineum TaxID=301880 RepID=A0ABQ5G834_9ASTR